MNLTILLNRNLSSACLSSSLSNVPHSSIISIIYGSCLGLHLQELQDEELQHGVLHLGGQYTVFPAILENKVIRCTVFPAILKNKVISRGTLHCITAILENKVISTGTLHCIYGHLGNKVIPSYLWTYDLYSPVGNAFDAGKSLMTFSGPIWHSPNGSMPFHRAQKSLDFQGLNHSHLPK
jgi:hypothetical protein